MAHRNKQDSPWKLLFSQVLSTWDVGHFQPAFEIPIKKLQKHLRASKRHTNLTTFWVQQFWNSSKDSFASFTKLCQDSGLSLLHTFFKHASAPSLLWSLLTWSSSALHTVPIKHETQVRTKSCGVYAILFTCILQTLGEKPYGSGNCYTPGTFPALSLCHSAEVALKQQRAS